jgi:queuine/archaeosine tRNA-ribosyltransferase
VTNQQVTSFRELLTTLQSNDRTIWLGQSVDTSTIHTCYDDFSEIPILTSIGCAMRRRKANGAKFDVGLRKRLGAGGPLMVDSGGFVLMAKKNRRWSAASVATLYDRIDADYLVSLDLPPNRDDRPSDRRRKYGSTIRNFELLFDQFGERVVPVVHGFGLNEVERNCLRIAQLCPSPALIGIGGLVPTLQRCGSIKRPSADSPHRTIANSIECVRTYFPKSKIHLFGVGSLHTVLGVIAAGANSVDSIGWRQAAGFGSVFIPGRHRRLLTERERQTPCRPFASRGDLDLLAACLCPACRHNGEIEDNVERLRRHFKPRAAHNIWVLYSEIARYLVAKSTDQGQAFLASRLSDAWLSALL